MFRIKTLDGGHSDMSSAEIEPLDAALRGAIHAPGSAEYETARTLWNGMVDRKPGLVVRAMGASDVQLVVNFARDHNLLLAVRSGGHQIAGHAVADGALLLDLSRMSSVRVAPSERTAVVEPGALLSDVDKETQAHALTVPLGINSTTGIAGLTLGGGFGWTTRKFGMTVDNLRAADVVTADGAIVTCSADDHTDLFWAIRGGGGNFGVVTAFEFDLHPLGPQVLSGLIVHPLDQAPDLLAAFAKLTDTAEDDLTVWAVLRKAPPLPFIPEDWHGKEVLIFAACYAGDMAEGERAMAELRSLGDPIADVIGPHPFVGWQAAFDPLLVSGQRNYWKSHDFESLPQAAIRELVAAANNLPDPATEIFIAHVGGAMARVAASDTAYPQRASHFIMNVHTRWAEPEKDATCIGWARDLFDTMAQYSTGGVYVNFMPEDETARLPNAYGGNIDRLARIKAHYDPGNLFRLNHNIQPASVPQAAE